MRVHDRRWSYIASRQSSANLEQRRSDSSQSGCFFSRVEGVKERRIARNTFYYIRASVNQTRTPFASVIAVISSGTTEQLFRYTGVFFSLPKSFKRSPELYLSLETIAKCLNGNGCYVA